MEDKKKLIKKIKDKEELKETPEKKKAKKTKKHTVDKRNRSLKLISVSSVILFIAIVMVFNFVFESLLGDKLQWDWSQTDLFSVGEITDKLLEDLDTEVKIIGLYDKGQGQNAMFNNIEILLEKYEQKSKGKVIVQYTNPVKLPSIVAEIDPNDTLKPKQYDFAVVCEKTGKTKILGIYDLLQIGYDQSYQQKIEGVTAEEAISGAILYVSSEETPIVYMTKGHGEEDYNTNYTVMTSVIRNNNFEIKDLDLLTTPKIPEDASLLIMLNAESDINAAGKNALEKYLKSGGSLMVLTRFGKAKFPVLNTLLSDYNIEITNDRIREGDKDRRFNDDPYAFIADAPAGMITEQAYEKSTLVIQARAIKKLKNTKEWIKVENFISKSDQAFVELEGDPEVAAQTGETAVALVSENSGFVDGANVTESAKVLVIGSADFIADPLLNYYGNQVYNLIGFIDSLNWLVDAESSDLMIRPKELPSYMLTSGSNTGYWAAAITTVVILPLALFIAALVVYRKRKNL